MSTRNYGQACSVARFLDQLGSRWTLLIVRDLLVGPRRFKDLLMSAPSMGPNLLTERLRQLQDLGILEKAGSGSAGSYVLTEKGRSLEPVILAMARWGLNHLPPDPARRGTSRPDLLVVAFRAAFNPARAAGVRETYAFHVDGVKFFARIDDGKIDTSLGDAEDAAFVMTADSETFDLLGSGELNIEHAMKRNLVNVTGDKKAFARFVDIFSA
ncbi:MAG: winged helix-turn-helix transcriptional regulator [Gammaproteobacteria bacterium]|nr:winged helix-turn-helix transcriptional regulator [Gammaproteobacteria bacterium]